VGGVTAAARCGAFVFLAVLVACLVADVAGWHRALAGAGGTAAFVAMVACLLLLRLRGGRR
jgi:hypothetical protein